MKITRTPRKRSCPYRLQLDLVLSVDSKQLNLEHKCSATLPSAIQRNSNVRKVGNVQIITGNGKAIARLGSLEGLLACHIQDLMGLPACELRPHTFWCENAEMRSPQQTTIPALNNLALTKGKHKWFSTWDAAVEFFARIVQLPLRGQSSPECVAHCVMQ